MRFHRWNLKIDKCTNGAPYNVMTWSKNVWSVVVFDRVKILMLKDEITSVSIENNVRELMQDVTALSGKRLSVNRIWTWWHVAWSPVENEKLGLYGVRWNHKKSGIVRIKFTKLGRLPCYIIRFPDWISRYWGWWFCCCYSVHRWSRTIEFGRCNFLLFEVDNDILLGDKRQVRPVGRACHKWRDHKKWRQESRAALPPK